MRDIVLCLVLFLRSDKADPGGPGWNWVDSGGPGQTRADPDGPPRTQEAGGHGWTQADPPINRLLSTG